ncbi:hypothetical protein ACEUW3_05935 [Staphylococcus pseudintermedius]|uniref:hypothetical protein n=1 Tax=Staphylococcus pseudintermedius TaxID=283734 RepID=UPI0020325356|nr:hypothetical protein [Staphylococcus pseudintermedius]MDK3614802.1 hypothetical protein [Staphylococcus pseudintermedius]MDK3877942.1 hypothetical protein [Staphylococcus pseudintermedius]MDK3943873.1 hypothetical protein [Staphylococcus pseudintermedius]WMZ44768.1 hypothetical protein QS415_09365 [Staphylococcus pseudintermedius]
MKNNFFIKSALSVVAFTLLTSSLGYSYVEASENVANVQKVDVSQVDKESANLEKELNTYLTLIEKMPDSVANQGIDSGVKWLNQNKGKSYEGYSFVNENNHLKLVQDNNAVVYKANWGACISMVGVAIASNAIPWAKILKVKKAAKAVGGIQKLTKVVVTAYKHQRNLGLSRGNAIKKAASIATKTFPQATRQAVIEFFSLGGLSSCF